MGVRCFSETTKIEYATKAAERSIKLEGGEDSEDFSTFFWGFVHLKIKSIQQLRKLGGNSRYRDLNKPRDGTPHDQQRRDNQSKDFGSRNRGFGSKIDQEASKTMLNFNKTKRCRSLPDCQSQEHKTYMCPRLVGKDASEAIRIATRASLCVSCLNPSSSDHQCPNKIRRQGY